jgi:dihydrofolate reductase
MAITANLAQSLDGFIADEHGGLDWLYEVPNPTGSDYGYADFMAGVDAVVMGRGTYDAVARFDEWPYDKPVIVLSRSRLQGSTPPDVEQRADPLPALVTELAERGWINLYVDGGRVVSSFLTAGLLDSLIISTLPVVLGRGIPLFSDVDGRHWLDHVHTEVLSEQIVRSHYTARRQPAS